ncbi:MAG: hypothetical protein GY953_33120, partial [bacterium]|nr:hypothetical protein [bacterium]
MSAPRQPIRFGPFEADPTAGELRKNGLRIKLQDHPFRILMILLSRPGEIVIREELQEELWPDGTFVEFEHSLNTSINKLRRALNDSADTPRYVETVPRRGYRFTGEVGQPALPQGKRPRPPLWPAAAVAIALAAFGAGWLIRTPPAPSLPVPLTTYPGRETHPSFSPEGDRVAFAWEGENRDNWDIYVKLIGQET